MSEEVEVHQTARVSVVIMLVRVLISIESKIFKRESSDWMSMKSIGTVNVQMLIGEWITSHCAVEEHMVHKVFKIQAYTIMGGY